MSSIFRGRGIRRTDKEVMECAILVADGNTIMQVEELMSIPHSTISWVVKNRLPRLDYDLYEKCIGVYAQHMKERHKKRNGRTNSTKKPN